MIVPKIKVRKKWSKEGVSEVIGNILILAITVVLFSAIAVMVLQLPPPSQGTIADFRAEMNFVSDDTAWLNITHSGGEQLHDYRIRIIIIQEGAEAEVRRLADGGLGDIWSVDSRWTMLLTGLTPSMKVDVRIVDIEANRIIWAGAVSGGQGMLAPVILQRWVDADPSTATPDPIRESDTTSFSLFVRVVDPDNDLNTSGVWVDSSALPSPNSHSHKTHTGSVIGGVWQFVFSNIPQGEARYYDGKPIFIYAKDEAGHETADILILSVQRPDVTNIDNRTFEYGPAVGESGLPLWLLYHDSEQGYVVLAENKTPPRVWGASANLSEPKNTFVHGEEWVFIRVGSMKMTNLLEKNQMQIVSRLSGQVLVPPSNDSAFYRVPYAGNAFIYEAKFNSSVLPPGAYDIIIDLQSSPMEGQSPVRLNAKTSLTILPGPGEDAIFMPELHIFKEDRRSNPSAEEWGTSDNPFDLSDVSTSILWVEITMQDVGSADACTIGSVKLANLRSQNILYGTPPSGDGMLGDKMSDATRSTYYFSVDLRLKNGVSWNTGKAAYSLTVSNVLDANEGVYTVSAPIWVTSPTTLRSYVVATSGIGVGHQNFAHFDYLFQIDNNKFFTTRILEERDETPGAGGGASLNVYKVLYFDIDEDGDRDVLAALVDTSTKPQSTYYLGIYINRLNQYGIWEPRTNFDGYTDNSAILSMAYGDVDGDGDLDWVISLANGKVYLYTNSYPITKTTLFTAKYFSEMRLADVTGDGKAELIGLVGSSRGTSSSTIEIYKISTGVPVQTGIVSPTGNFIWDFDIGDIDNDGDIDIAVVTSSATYGVRWYERTQTLTAPALATADPDTYTGTRVEGTYASTHSSDNSYLAIREDANRLSYVLPVATVSGTKPTLYAEVKAGAGASEGFYFFYSVSPTGPWTFMFPVPATTTTDTTFSFPLPLQTSGTIYVRITDSSTAGSSDDTIYIDHLYVQGILEVSYATSHVISTDTTYRAIGIGEFDGIGFKDVALGKSGALRVISIVDRTTTSTLYDNTTITTFAPNGDRFEVRDVNGDGRADIVSVFNYDGKAVILYQWLNLGSGTAFRGMEVKNLSIHVGGGWGAQYVGDIQSIAVENMYGP